MNFFKYPCILCSQNVQSTNFGIVAELLQRVLPSWRLLRSMGTVTSAHMSEWSPPWLQGTHLLLVTLRYVFLLPSSSHFFKCSSEKESILSPSAVSLPQFCKEQGVAGTQNPDLPCGQQGSSYLSHHCCLPSVCISRKLEWEPEQVCNRGTPEQYMGILPTAI